MQKAQIGKIISAGGYIRNGVIYAPVKGKRGTYKAGPRLQKRQVQALVKNPNIVSNRTYDDAVEIRLKRSNG